MADDVKQTTDIDDAIWREAMGSFPSGVIVATTWDGDCPVGTTHSSFCSVSLDPPLLLICSAHYSRITEPVRKTGSFGINFLAHDQGDLAFNFSVGPRAKGFADLEFTHDEGRPPRIAGSPVFIDCDLEHSYPGGDHQIHVGRGVKVVIASGEHPLLYHKGEFPPLYPR